MNTGNHNIAPHSIESEQSVIGSLLLNNEHWERIADIVVRDDFYGPEYRVIFEAITTLLESNRPADILTVKEYIKKNNPDIGIDFKYLANIAENTPNISHIEAYAKQVRESSVYRQLISISSELSGKAYNHKDMELEQIIDFAEAKIFSIADQTMRNKNSIFNAKNIIPTIKDKIERMKHTDGITGLKTGFYDFDKLTSGLQNGDLIILAGRPGMGKTALAMNIIENIAIMDIKPKPVAVFSLEMPKEQLVMRIISSNAEIDNKKIYNMSDHEWEKFNHTTLVMENSTILIDESAILTPTEIKAKCRRLKRDYPDLALVVIDYIQLMTVYGKLENRNQEISEISRSLKSLAKELSIPVIVISQLNRGVESRSKEHQGRMPQMSDLRESGSLEQDADIVAFIYRDEYYNPNDKTVAGEADLRIAKHRNGATGNVKLTFIGKYAHFKNATQQEDISKGDIKYSQDLENDFTC